jgi:hypothetical protein
MVQSWRMVLCVAGLSSCAGSLGAFPGPETDFGQRREALKAEIKQTISAGNGAVRWHAGRCDDFVVLYQIDLFSSYFEYFDDDGKKVGDRHCSDLTNSPKSCEPSQFLDPRCNHPVHHAVSLLQEAVGDSVRTPRIAVRCGGRACDNDKKFTINVDGAVFKDDAVATTRKKKGEIILGFPQQVRLVYSTHKDLFRVDLVSAEAPLRVQRQRADHSSFAVLAPDGDVVAQIEILPLRALDQASGD